MKNCIFILLWCIPGFLFSVTPKPDVEKLTETADTYYQAGKVDSALWAIEQALQLAMTEKDTCAMMSCYTSQGVLPALVRETHRSNCCLRQSPAICAPSFR